VHVKLLQKTASVSAGSQYPRRRNREIQCNSEWSARNPILRGALLSFDAIPNVSAMASTYMQAQEQKSFGSFLQKRTPS
jgi:hypothetical protein